MTELTAEQIVERIAHANGIEPAVMRQRIEQVISQPHFSLCADRLSEGEHSLEERIVALEAKLYDVMVPQFIGWQWDGDGYWNIRLLGKK